jgi:hypothetical protein
MSINANAAHRRSNSLAKATELESLKFAIHHRKRAPVIAALQRQNSKKTTYIDTGSIYRMIRRNLSELAVLVHNGLVLSKR